MVRTLLIQMWRHEVPPNMCHGTYVAINQLITKSYTNNIKMNDDINASVTAECIIKTRQVTRATHVRNSLSTG